MLPPHTSSKTQRAPCRTGMISLRWKDTIDVDVMCAAKREFLRKFSLSCWTASFYQLVRGSNNTMTTLQLRFLGTGNNSAMFATGKCLVTWPHRFAHKAGWNRRCQGKQWFSIVCNNLDCCIRTGNGVHFCYTCSYIRNFWMWHIKYLAFIIWFNIMHDVLTTFQKCIFLQSCLECC